MTTFKAVIGNEQEVHVRVRLFAGPDADHLALLGSVTARKDEADDLGAVLEAGGFWLRRDAAEDGERPRIEVIVERQAPKVTKQAVPYEPEF